MNRLIAGLIIGSLALVSVTGYAADTVKSAGEATAKEPGTVNDPASAEKKQTGSKKAIKAQGGPCTPGAGDPSAAAKGSAKGADVKCEPEASANPSHGPTVKK